MKQATNPHILNLSPPILMEPQWLAPHLPYTLSKYGMSMCVLGLHEELRDDGIAVNALWPMTMVWTAAGGSIVNKLAILYLVSNIVLSGQEDGKKECRKVEIMSDAAYVMLSKPSRKYTGHFAIDEEVLREEGIVNFDSYAYDPSKS
jgi:citronellol/citronellal dehydrogenase